MMKNFFVCTYEFLGRLIFGLPRHKVFNFFKSNYMRAQGCEIGRDITFYPGIKINPARNIILGNNVDLAWGVIITTTGGVEIGDRTLIGYRTLISSANHNIPSNREHIFGSGHTAKKVTIGRDCWIGGNSVIVAGVTIGDGAVVGAGSVVTKDVKPYTVVGGVPAKFLRERD
ncbi:putative acetyltransferase [Dokdonia sp. MED134]|uniref:acyltransferase n=1 Tax=Dokdonia sp. MED134 TaxID=313590 RepID=UPI000068AAB3|nr:acyltransferase [Dokdonia sp. MED134]EAQ40278.1 putative acetyltransferase [Dokdonia sp. MED134]